MTGMSDTYIIALSLENETWSDEWDTSINPVEATAYGHLAVQNGLLLQMYHEGDVKNGDGYGGWLCKHVSQLPGELAHLRMSYEITVDDATHLSAQVIETDVRITDSIGRTFLGDFQFNIADNWRVQVGSPWEDTDAIVEPFKVGKVTSVRIYFFLNYYDGTMTIESVDVNGAVYAIDRTFDAENIGWQANQIVTQLQQCNRAVPGGYTLKFENVRYRFSTE